MTYQITSHNTERGFSVVELLVVLAVFAILIAVSDTAYVSFASHNSLEIATNSFIEATRHAQSNAMVAKNDSAWGVELLTNSAVIFEGNTYAGRNTSFDQTIALPAGVTSGGLSEIVFTKLTGATTNTGTVTLTNSFGIKNIQINAKGIITY